MYAQLLVNITQNKILDVQLLEPRHLAVFALIPARSSSRTTKFLVIIWGGTSCGHRWNEYEIIMRKIWFIMFVLMMYELTETVRLIEYIDSIRFG